MDKRLYSLKPVQSLLPLTAADKCLQTGLEDISIPPKDLSERCLLAYCTIRQSSYAGTYLLDRLLRNPPGGNDHLVPILLYRHMLDLGDSIGTLLRFGSSSNAAILVRALFESILGLEFILQGKTFHRERAVCYRVFYWIKQLRNFTKYDPATEEGKEFHKILDADKKLERAVFPRRDHSIERKEILQLLNSIEYKSVWDKYQKAKSKSKHWYSLCSDKRDLKGLAQLVGRESEYLLLYRLLSEPAHASDVFTKILKTLPGKGIQIHVIRGPEDRLQESAMLTAEGVPSLVEN